MGLNIKTAGVTIGGLTAIYLATKMLNVFERTIQNVTEASKWKNYYKYGDQAYSVPPGYARQRVDNSEVKSPEAQEEDEKAEKRQAKEENKKPVDMSAIADSFERVAKAYLKTKGINLDASDRNRDQAAYKRTTYADYSKSYHSCHSDVAQKAEDKTIKEEIEDAFHKDQKDDDYIYLIGENVYLQTKPYYDKQRLVWYAKDNVLLDEDDNIISPMSCIGLSWEKLCELVDDKTEEECINRKTYYIRNDHLKMDFEIFQIPGTYFEVIGSNNDISEDDTVNKEDTEQ